MVANMVFFQKKYLFTFFVEYDWSKTVRTKFDHSGVEFTSTLIRSDFVHLDQNYCAFNSSKKIDR